MADRFQLETESITLEALFEAMPVAMVLLDREGRHVAVNQALASFSGLQAKDLIGRKVADLSPESAENIQRDFRHFDAGLEVPDHELQLGDQILLVSVKPVRARNGQVIGEMVAMKDIKRQKQIERDLAEANAQLQRLANHDPLTDLLNARAYAEMCDHLMSAAKRNGAVFSALFVDLDHFKRINDTYGHEAGDAVLRSIADCIVGKTRQSDLVGRVGGEEFAVFLSATDRTGAMQVAENIRSEIEKRVILVHGTPIQVTASIGVSSCRPHHKSIADLQRDADHAMYHAKKMGRNRVCLLDEPCYIGRALAEQEQSIRGGE